jgi:4-nitrophenyl phosphatase
MTMKHYDGYLIDLDGTMYRGSDKIEEAVTFVKQLKERKLPYLFVTNNSTATREQVAKKLNNFDVPCEPDDVITTSTAAASFLSSQYEGKRLYVIGEEGLFTALEEKGFEIEETNPDHVIIGLDRSVNYEKFVLACLAVRNGATFISTNGDIALPTERGFLPGNGSLTSVITTSTGVQPIFIGKPESLIVEMALKQLGIEKHEAIMVGDNYNTDILAGIRAGVDTLLVYTGVTKSEHLKEVEHMPTYQINSLCEWKF